MSYSTPQGEIAIDGIHSRALSNAIGERLQDSLDTTMAMPPHLVSLLKQMSLSDVPVVTR